MMIKSIVKRQMEHTFEKANVRIGIRSFIHAMIVILIVATIPPHDWQVSFGFGLCYGTIMHFLLHYRAEIVE